jgi:type IV pilus assembly protein PilQ
MIHIRHSLSAVALAFIALSVCPAMAQKKIPEPKPLEQKVAPVDPEQQIMSPLDVKDADIQDVVRTISRGYNLNIVLDKEVTGKVTVHLTEVPVIEGLRTLSKSIGLEVVKEGNVYRIRKTTDEQRSVISFSRGKLTVDVQNMDVREFLKDISAKTAISIVPDSKVEGKVTGKLYQVELDDGLRALLEGSGLKIAKRKNIYQVIAGEPSAQQGGGMQPSYPGSYQRFGKSSGNASLNVDYSNGKISLDVTNGNLSEVIKSIADQSDMQIITYGTISGEINAKLKNVPLTEALALLLGGTMFTFVQKDSIILIGDRNAATPAGQALSKSELVHLNCIKADGVMQVLPKDIPPNNVKIIKEQNALLVSGTSEDIVSVKAFLKTIDIPTPQVCINAVIVEYKENIGSDFGISGGNRPDLKDQSYFTHPTPTFAKKQGGDGTEIGWSGKSIINEFLINSLKLGPTNTLISMIPEDYFLFIRFLETQDKAKVLAQPSIVTLNGNKASISVDETQYFPITTGSLMTNEQFVSKVQPITFGIKLDITPWISKGGQITAEITPVVSNSDGKTGDYPNISQRSISTTVRLDDGQTLILGGLVKNQETDALRKMPFFGDLPLIGFLFRNTMKVRTKSNLVVYITPHILTKDYAVNLKQELQNLDKTNKEFMDRKIEDTINKESVKNKPGTASGGDTTARATGATNKPQPPLQKGPVLPAADSVHQDSVKAPR